MRVATTGNPPSAFCMWRRGPHFFVERAAACLGRCRTSGPSTASRTSKIDISEAARASAYPPLGPLREVKIPQAVSLPRMLDRKRREVPVSAAIDEQRTSCPSPPATATSISARIAHCADADAFIVPHIDRIAGISSGSALCTNNVKRTAPETRSKTSVTRWRPNSKCCRVSAASAAAFLGGFDDWTPRKPIARQSQAAILPRVNKSARHWR
jgi:hypothetical protein